MNIQLLYGGEFWCKFEALLNNAKERVFIASAYLGQNDYRRVIQAIPKGIFYYFATRDENSNYKPNSRCILINKNYFHGKIYLIDNCVIIGSQNLYKPKVIRQGEFSVLFNTDNFTSSVILYQALLKISQQSPVTIEPVNSKFLDFYGYGCPFCGNSMTAEPLTIHRCPEYGGGFISDEDCSSYNNTGACKYCIPENRENIGECYCCDHFGCGFGISLDSSSFIYHTFDPPDKEKEARAKEFVRLFNFLAQYMNQNDIINLFNSLGFNGRIYDVQLERLEWDIT